MIKIAQFGEGNFLRSFVDLYFETLNSEGGEYSVDIIKPIKFGSLEAFEHQKNKYHVILRGVVDGKPSEEVYPVSSIAGTVSPFEEMGKYLKLARDANLKIIVSNTTEAGICFNENDKRSDFENMTFPGKLTLFLYERYKANLDGVYLLPVELIENNADTLYDAVDNYISLWNLGEDFRNYNKEKNFYCNTLVDRIVSGYPRDEETRTHLEKLIGKKDTLMSVAEPFGLWVIENKGNVSNFIKDGKHNIEIILTDDIGYYKKRKVRVLNGSHTNLVAVGMCHGKETVYDFMRDKKLYDFFTRSLSEIIPFVSDNIKETTEFAKAVEDRFFNPYLNHQLKSISLNSISKWKARCLPTFKDYYKAKGEIPSCLTVGFSYLMYMYKNKYSILTDNESYLRYFADGGSVEGFMKDEKIWGEDLTKYPEFYERVQKNVKALEKGCLII